MGRQISGKDGLYSWVKIGWKIWLKMGGKNVVEFFLDKLG